MGKGRKYFILMLFVYAFLFADINVNKMCSVNATSPKDLVVIVITDYKTTTMNDPNAGVVLSSDITIEGITWDDEHGVLTLDGYNAGPINISRSGKGDSLADIEVKIVGNNTIHAFENLNVSGTPPIGFLGVNATFTGNGTLNVVSKGSLGYTYSFDVKGNVNWNGPSLKLLDAGFGLDIKAAPVAEYDGETKTGEHYEGGNLTVNSGEMSIVMNSVIEKSKDAGGNEVSDLYYYNHVSAEGEIKIIGGTVVLAMKPNEKDYNGSNNLPVSLLVSDSSITVKNAKIIAAIDPMFENVSIYSIYSTETKTSQTTSDKIKIDSSATVIRVSGLDFSKFKIKLTSDSYIYDGKEKKPEIAIDGLKKGTDYIVEYKNNINVGTGTVAITGKGYFTGTAVAEFNIAPMDKGSLVNNGNYQYCITKKGNLQSGGEMSVVGPLSTKIKNASIPDTVTVGGMKYKITSIEKKAFLNCVKLSKVTIGANVKTIGSSSFAGDKNLTTVNIKSKALKKIGTKAFYGDSKLKKITLKTTKLSSIGKNAFKGTKSNATYKLPKSKLKKYKSMIKKAGAGIFSKYKK